MIDRTAAWVADSAGGRLVAGAAGAPGPKRATIDSRTAAEGDVIVVAGKGHEQGQEFEGGRKIAFDDVRVAREALRARVVA